MTFRPYIHDDLDEVTRAHDSVTLTNLEYDALKGRIAALEAALRGLSKMYSDAWDRVDGALVMMGSSVGEFEEAHRIAEETLAASALETSCEHTWQPVMKSSGKADDACTRCGVLRSTLNAETEGKQ